MAKPTPDTTPELTREEKIDRLRTKVGDWQESYRDLLMDDSDAGINARAMLRAKLKRLGHDHIHPGEERVSLTVPQAADGSFFIINDQTFFGDVEVPACVAQTLIHMIDHNRRVDGERFRENGRTRNLDGLSGIAQQLAIQGD